MTWRSLCGACSAGQHTGAGCGGVCQCDCHKPSAANDHEGGWTDEDWATPDLGTAPADPFASDVLTKGSAVKSHDSADSGTAAYHELVVDPDTYRQLEEIAALLAVDVEDVLARVIHDASYVYNSEAIDRG